ncbi:hypothetical protein GCM10025734_61230 [Kitasatospora paranensis]
MPPTPRAVDPLFTGYPLTALADAALGRARELGAGHADFRMERVRSASWRLRDARPSGGSDSVQLGFAVRVLLDGAWGFAAGVDLTTAAAARVAEQAVAVARLSGSISRAAGSPDVVELADEPVHADAVWVSAYEENPFDVPDAEKTALLADWSGRLLAADGVSHVTAALLTVQENKFYADTAGTVTTQQRIRLHPGWRPPRSTGAAAPSTRCARWPRRPAAASSTCAAPAGTGTPNSPSSPRCSPRR